jgi:hypothetical protein
MPSSVYPELQSGVLLCIDDDQDVLECEKAFLESFGYTVLTAASGGKGLELASMYPVDVVIVDYFMPEMNGQEVAIEMRRLNPQAPIIMLSRAGSRWPLPAHAPEHRETDESLAANGSHLFSRVCKFDQPCSGPTSYHPHP